MLRCCWVDDTAAYCPQPCERPFLISADQAGVAGNIYHQDGGEPPLDTPFTYPVVLKCASWPRGTQPMTERTLLRVVGASETLERHIGAKLQR
jgi:hypothetical protein